MRPTLPVIMELATGGAGGAAERARLGFMIVASLAVMVKAIPQRCESSERVRGLDHQTAG